MALSEKTDDKKQLWDYLQWGKHSEITIFDNEGQVKFSDVPVSMILDKNQEQIQADLRLDLEMKYQD